jgi:hypothetical protein
MHAMDLLLMDWTLLSSKIWFQRSPFLYLWLPVKTHIINSSGAHVGVSSSLPFQVYRGERDHA